MTDVIVKAEKNIKALIRVDKFKGNVLDLKTNQIRKFLSAVNSVSNKVAVFKAKNPGAKELDNAIADEIRYLQVMLVYQIGREKANSRYAGPLEKFEDEAKLLTTIKNIGNSIEAFEEFARYTEALVAYHKYYGGRD